MIRVAALACAALALSACASIDPYPAQRPVLAPQAYAGDLPASGVAETWWRGFQDPVLEELVEEGLAANIDIAIARDRLRGAAALLRAERADRLPRVDGAADASIGIGTFDSDSASIGLLGTFDPDISGRLDAEIRAAAADYAQAEYVVADQRRLVAIRERVHDASGARVHDAIREQRADECVGLDVHHDQVLAVLDGGQRVADASRRAASRLDQHVQGRRSYQSVGVVGHAGRARGGGGVHAARSVGCIRPANLRQRLARLRDLPVRHAKHVQAGSAPRLRQEHRAELAAADDPDTNGRRRPRSQERVEVHG